MTSSREPLEPARLTDDEDAPRELRQALQEAQAHRPIADRLDVLRASLLRSMAASPSNRPPARSPRRRWMPWGFGLGVAALLGGSAWAFFVESPRPVLDAGNASTEGSATSAPAHPTSPEPLDPSSVEEELARPSEIAPRKPPLSSPVAPASSLAAERRLVARARELLSSSPSEALRATDRHGTMFPDGLLAQEREVIAITALANLGRFDEARARADRFDQRFPGSAHAARVRASIRRLEKTSED